MSEAITGGLIVVLAGPEVTVGLKMALRPQAVVPVGEVHPLGRVDHMIKEWKWREEGRFCLACSILMESGPHYVILQTLKIV